MKKRFLSAFLAILVAMSVSTGALASGSAAGDTSVSSLAAISTESVTDASYSAATTQTLSSSQISNGWIEPNIRISSSGSGASRAASGNRLYSSSTLPASYSLVDLSRVTSVKNQGSYNTCWTFGATASAESNLLTKSLAVLGSLDLSEVQLGYYTYNRTSTSQPEGCVGDTSSPGSGYTFDELGGNDFMSVSSLSRWVGAVNESDAPYSSIRTTLNDSTLVNGKNSYVLTNAEMFPMEDMTNVKKEIMTNGAVSSAYGDYRSLSMYGADYYNDSTYSYYNPDVSNFSGNHEICIVGWNDNYSKSNFSSVDNRNHTTAVQPKADGAWLIKNSWGTYSGNGGYFWISYEDTSLNNESATSYQMTPVSQSYGHNYQYDGGLCTDYYDIPGTSVSMSNVFTSSGLQQLKAVSFWTLQTALGYTAKVYSYVSGEPTSGTLVSSATVSGTMASAGYHTVVLSSPVQLTKGEKFAVVITLSSGSSGATNMQLAFDESYTATNTSGDVYYTAHSSSQAGQSYYTSGSSWVDVSSAGNQNFRIKAFADDAQPTSISVSAAPEKTAYKIGEKFDPTGLVLKAKYSDGSTSLIKYSDENKGAFSFSPSLTQALAVSDTSVQITYAGLISAQNISVSANPSSAATPVISPSYGSFYDSQSVSISCSTAGASVRYTLDGSEPTTSSALYTAPFTLTSSATVKAKAYKDGSLSSSTASVDYTKLDHVYYNGVDYSAVFDWTYYTSIYPDIKAAFGSDKAAALAHFVNYGMNEGRQGSPSFDVFSYLRAYRDLRSVFHTDLKSYYLHYVSYGKNEGRVATGVNVMRDPVTVYNGVDYSAVYDFNSYISSYSDIRGLYGLNDDGALAHFVNYGLSEGRQGSSSFDVGSYLRAYRDLRSAFGVNLRNYYTHYISYGKGEGRVATGVTVMRDPVTVYNGIDYSAVYDYNSYITYYGDIRNLYGLSDDGALAHFVNFGMNEGRQGSAYFDVNSYRRAYRDLRSAFGGNLRNYYLHYISNGKGEGRVATGVTVMRDPVTVYNGVDYSAVYDFNSYISYYSDIRGLYGLDDDSALSHFVNFGMSEGRQGSPYFNVGIYLSNYSDLRAAFGNDLKAYYIHYLRYGRFEGRTAV